MSVELRILKDSSIAKVNWEGDTVYPIFHTIQLKTDLWSNLYPDSIFDDRVTVWPTKIIDTANNLVFLNVFGSQLLKLDVKDGSELAKFVFHPFRSSEENDNNSFIRLEDYKRYQPDLSLFGDNRLYVKTLKNVLVFDSDLNLLSSYRDTITQLFRDKHALNYGHLSSIDYVFKKDSLTINASYAEYEIDEITDDSFTFVQP